MAYSPIALTVPQFHVNGEPASGYVLKAYQAGTSTLLQMATDSSAGTLVNDVVLNSAGYPAVSGNIIIPHVNAEFKLALYPSQTAADANSGATWTIDDLTPTGISEDQVVTISTLTNLRNYDGVATTVILDGAAAAGDSFGAIYYKVTGASAGTYSDNGGSIIVPTGGDGSEAWLTINVVAVVAAAASAKTTPVDADTVPLIDSAASSALKKLTFSNLWAWIKSKIESVTFSTFTVTSLDANGGTVDNTTIGASSRASGAFSAVRVGTSDSGDGEAIRVLISATGARGLILETSASGSPAAPFLSWKDGDGNTFRIRMNAGNLSMGTGFFSELFRLTSSGAFEICGVAVPTISSTSTFSNKSIALGSNTVTGTKAQYDTSCSDGNFVYEADAASQAEQETGSATDKFVSPGRQHYHQSASKGWAFFSISAGSPTLQSSYNVNSITDSAQGVFIVNWETDFSSANYSVTLCRGRWYVFRCNHIKGSRVGNDYNL